jgi:hypothetical protein
MGRRSIPRLMRGGAVQRKPRPQHATAYRTLCAQMKRWRMEAGLTQVGMAAKLRLTQSQVAKTRAATAGSIPSSSLPGPGRAG